MSKFLLIYFSIFLTCFTGVSTAEDDPDLEFEFARHQKSTLENFPMESIDQEAMSDAAIEGALLVQSRQHNNSAQNGKPIYQKLDEDNQKKQSEEVLSEKEMDIVAEDNLVKFAQDLPPPPQFQPIIYQQPTGRTYTDHQTTTTSRP